MPNNIQDGECSLKLSNVTKIYKQGGKTIKILDRLSLNLAKGQCAALVGPSGSGKSTLLHIAGLLDQPDSGHIHILGRNIAGMKLGKIPAFRNKSIGFVYQFHFLQKEFSALENVMVPLLINGQAYSSARTDSKKILSELGLAKRFDHKPSQLSGGEQQRVAIARALVRAPGLIIADEPTGNLDGETSERVFALLMSLIREKNLSALIATHNIELAMRMDLVYKVTNGKLTNDTK